MTTLEKVIAFYDSVLRCRYGIDKVMLTFAHIESDMKIRAKRVEEGFYKAYMKGRPRWEVFVKKFGEDAYASHGPFQIMWSTAFIHDKDITPEDLYNPYVSCYIAFKIIEHNIRKHGVDNEDEWIQEYNGGANRSEQTQRYYKKWLKVWAELKK